jgi:hypothetical protein
MRGPTLSLRQQRERDALRSALELLLPGRPLEDFDDERFVGTHDDVDGVQWHVALERAQMTRLFAVNLEGLAYRNWPIATFLWREAQELRLLQVIRDVAGPEQIHVHLTRDAWTSVRTRVAVDEWYLLRRPLAELTPRIWESALIKAKACLRGPNGGRGSAEVTVSHSQVRRELEVCPHLNLGVELQSTGHVEERLAEMREVMKQLEPLHCFVAG